MCSNFECIVCIGDTKHTISIDCHINCVTFSDVYNKIIKIDSKTKISFETHVFEIFDFDINSFVRIISSNQLIKYLSRIRVSPKTTQNTDNSNKKTSNDKQLKHNYINREFNDFETKNNYNYMNNKRNGLQSNDNTNWWTPSIGNQSSSPLLTANTSQTQTYSPLLINYFNRSNKLNANPNKTLNSFKDNVNVKRLENRNTSTGNTKNLKDSNEITLKELFETEGMSIEGGIEQKIICRLCSKYCYQIKSGLEHMTTEEHIKNMSEEGYEDIDKQFLTKIGDKNTILAIESRKKEIKNFDKCLKQKLIEHGIRLKDGFGSQCYVCLTCQQVFDDSKQMLFHYKLNDKTNEETERETKPIAYRFVDPLIDKLLSTGITTQFKRDKIKYFECVLCDSKINTGSIDDAFIHSQTKGHIKRKTERKYKGIDKLLLTDTRDSADIPIELVLGRMKALKRLDSIWKKVFVINDIKIHNGFGDNSYVCTKCKQFFETKRQIEKHLKKCHFLDKTFANLLEKSHKVKHKTKR